jgi:hypothetical protein
MAESSRMTLFIFKKKPLVVTLFTANESAFKFARPQKAAHFIPDWWKKLPKKDYRGEQAPSVMSSISTMKTCAGIVDLYSSGFIHPMWSDLSVEVHPDGTFVYQYSDGISSAIEHLTQQRTGSHFNHSYNHLKLNSPWVARESTGVKFLTSAPIWNGFGTDDVCVPPGVSGYKVPINLNINLFLRREVERKVYTFNFGQPIAHFIPLSDRPLKLSYELISDEERRKMYRLGGMPLFFTNRNKKAEKLCPYA